MPPHPPAPPLPEQEQQQQQRRSAADAASHHGDEDGGAGQHQRPHPPPLFGGQEALQPLGQRWEGCGRCQTLPQAKGGRGRERLDDAGRLPHSGLVHPVQARHARPDGGRPHGVDGARPGQRGVPNSSAWWGRGPTAAVNVTLPRLCHRWVAAESATGARTSRRRVCVRGLSNVQLQRPGCLSLEGNRPAGGKVREGGVLWVGHKCRAGALQSPFSGEGCPHSCQNCHRMEYSYGFPHTHQDGGG